MPYIRVWIHYVWSTKNRELLLTPEIRPRVFDHIRENANKKNIILDSINGYTDHVHCLISMRRGQTIDKIAQLIKGESSHWINKNELTESRFEWQDEFYAVSVSESAVNSLRKYILNQEEHHKNVSFNEEYELLIAGLPKLPGT